MILWQTVLYLTSDYDSLRKEQGYSGYAVYYKRQSDKHAGRDVANFNLFVRLLKIDSRLGSKNEEQLALLLMCAFPNLRFINVSFFGKLLPPKIGGNTLNFETIFRPFQLQIILQRILADMLHFIWQKIMIKLLIEPIFILITTLKYFKNFLSWINDLQRMKISLHFA